MAKASKFAHRMDVENPKSLYLNKYLNLTMKGGDNQLPLGTDLSSDLTLETRVDDPPPSPDKKRQVLAPPLSITPKSFVQNLTFFAVPGGIASPAERSTASKFSPKGEILRKESDIEDEVISTFVTSKTTKETATNDLLDLEMIKRNASIATSVRRHLGNKTLTASLKKPSEVKFNFSEFLKTMGYEMTPPAIISPLLALLIEGSTERAYHAINHRLLFPCDRSYYRSAPSLPFIFWLMVFPMIFLFHASFILTIVYRDDIKESIDVWEVVVMYLGFVCRNMILAVKYGYFSSEEREAIRKPAPEWSIDHSNRKLIGAGWKNPLEHEDLIEEEIFLAQKIIDVNLFAANFQVDDDVAEVLRNYEAHEEFRAKTPINEKNEISASFVLHQIVRKSFGDAIPRGFLGKVCNIAPFLLAFLPAFVRSVGYGLPPFGESHVEKTIHSGMLILRLWAFGSLFNFAAVSVHDFRRRRKAMENIGKLCEFPGLPLVDFLSPQHWKGEQAENKALKLRKKQLNKKSQSQPHKKDDDIREKEAQASGYAGAKIHLNESPAAKNDRDLEAGADKSEQKRYCYNSQAVITGSLSIDLRRDKNAFSWVIMRRVMRAFGGTYNKRCQAYVGVLYSWAFMCGILINIIFWTSRTHHVATVVYTLANTFVTCYMVLSGVTDATKLQAMVTTHRMLLKNEILALTQRINDLESTLFKNVKYNEDAKDLLSPSMRPNYDEGEEKTLPKSAIREQVTKLEIAKKIIVSADDIIGYEDELHNPVRVMTFEATNGVFNSTIGVIVTFLVLAVEGFSGNVKYNALGWSE